MPAGKRMARAMPKTSMPKTSMPGASTRSPTRLTAARKFPPESMGTGFGKRREAREIPAGRKPNPFPPERAKLNSRSPGTYRIRTGDTLGEIARVVRVLENLDDGGEKDALSDLADQVLQPIWSEMQEDLMVRLDKITIEDICRRATRLGVKRAADTNIDFII